MVDAENPNPPSDKLPESDLPKAAESLIETGPLETNAEGAHIPNVEKDTISATTDSKVPVKRKTLSLVIHDVGVLRAAYMQFVKGGGLFIPTKKSFNMGEDTNLIIKLLDDTEPYRVVARVVWITPAGTANNKTGGIGVEFAEDRNGEMLRSRIEVILGPHLKSTESTHTM